MNWTDERVEKLKKLWSGGPERQPDRGAVGRRQPQRGHRKGSSTEPAGARKAGGSTTAAARPKRATSAPRAPNYAARSVTRTVTRTAGATALRKSSQSTWKWTRSCRSTGTSSCRCRGGWSSLSLRTHLQVADRATRSRKSSTSAATTPRKPLPIAPSCPAGLPALCRAPAHAAEAPCSSRLDAR